MTMTDETPGVRFVRMVRCLILARGDHEEAVRIAEILFGDDEGISNALKKDRMLDGANADIFSDFNAYLMPKTLVGCAEVTRIPFRTSVVSQASTEPFMLEPRRHTALVTLTEDIARDSSPSAELVIRDYLVNALVARIDDAFRSDIVPDTSQTIYVADEGGISVQLSFDLTPEHFENDLVVVKVTRTIAWAQR